MHSKLKFVIIVRYEIVPHLSDLEFISIRRFSLVSFGVKIHAATSSYNEVFDRLGEIMR